MGNTAIGVWMYITNKELWAWGVNIRQKRH